MQSTTAYKCRINLLDSAEELIARLDLPTVSETHHTDKWVRTHGEFIGREFASIAAARDAASVLWQDGMNELDRMRNDLAAVELPKPTCRRRRLKWDDSTGDEIDNDRLRSGQDYWRSSHREVVEGPATRVIFIHLGGNGATNSIDFLWRGAAAIALAEALENAGYRVEIWGTVSVTDRFTDATPNEFTAIQLKAAGDVLDPSTLVNVCSGWFYRTVFWRGVETIGPVNPSMGCNNAPSPWQLDLVSTAADRIVIANVFSYEAALDCVRRELTPLAV